MFGHWPKTIWNQYNSEKYLKKIKFWQQNLLHFFTLGIACDNAGDFWINWLNLGKINFQNSCLNAWFSTFLYASLVFLNDILSE